MRREVRSNIGITPLLVAVTKHSPSARPPDSADNIALTLLSNVDAKTLVDGSLKTMRGKRLPIRVPKSSTCKQVLSEGVEKWKKFDRCLDASKSYSLVYEDGTIPFALR